MLCCCSDIVDVAALVVVVRNDEDQLTQEHGISIASNASIAYNTNNKQR